MTSIPHLSCTSLHVPEETDAEKGRRFYRNRCATSGSYSHLNVLQTSGKEGLLPDSRTSWQHVPSHQHVLPNDIREITGVTEWWLVKHINRLRPSITKNFSVTRWCFNLNVCVSLVSLQGDSGGLLVCDSHNRFILQGLTFCGLGCANAMKSGVCTQVSTFTVWICQSIKYN